MLAPFGLAGHDPTGLAVARLAWMLLGVVNTVLVARILRPVGLLGPAVGGLFYATAFSGGLHRMDPAVGGAGPNLCLVRGTASRPSRADWMPPTRVGVVACARLLGVSATFKIWGVVPVATVLVWLLVGPVALADRVSVAYGSRRRGDRDLPALLRRGADTDVADGRRRSAGAWALQLVAVRPAGRHPHPRPAPSGASAGRVVAARSIVVAALLAVAFTVRQARLCVVLALALTTLLLASPSVVPALSGMIGTGPLAVALGAGTGVLVDRLAGWRTWVGWAGGVLAFVVLAVAAAPLTELRLGRPFPPASSRTEHPRRPRPA